MKKTVMTLTIDPTTQEALQDARYGATTTVALILPNGETAGEWSIGHPCVVALINALNEDINTCPPRPGRSGPQEHCDMHERADEAFTRWLDAIREWVRKVKREKQTS